jgi:hypothetical protein
VARFLGVDAYDLRRLFEYDGRQACWRVAFAVLLRCGPPLLSLAAFGAGVVAGIHLEVLRLLGCGAVALAATAMATRTSRQATWTTVIYDRLRSYHDVNPERYVSVHLRWDDVAAATVALRRAKLTPGAAFRPPTPLPDAPEINARMNVTEPVAWPQSQSGDDFVSLVTSTLARAGVRARAAGIDAFPDGTVSPWDDPVLAAAPSVSG